VHGPQRAKGNDMIVCGVDPAPEGFYWAAVECVALGVLGKHRVLGSGHGATITDLPAAELYALERPDFRPIGGRGNVGQSLAMAKCLTATARTEGRMLGRLEERGLRVVDPTCGEVRTSLVGKPSCKDSDVSWALEHVCELPKRSNAHVRDAVAVAIVGARVWCAMQLPGAAVLGDMGGGA
jgi:hypothetical protein